jgi:hypothetical protein
VAGFAPCFGVKKSRENEIIATIRLESDYCAENSFILALFLIRILTLAPALILRAVHTECRSTSMSKNRNKSKPGR